MSTAAHELIALLMAAQEDQTEVTVITAAGYTVTGLVLDADPQAATVELQATGRLATVIVVVRQIAVVERPRPPDRRALSGAQEGQKTYAVTPTRSTRPSSPGSRCGQETPDAVRRAWRFERIQAASTCAVNQPLSTRSSSPAVLVQ